MPEVIRAFGRPENRASMKSRITQGNGPSVSNDDSDHFTAEFAAFYAKMAELKSKRRLTQNVGKYMLVRKNRVVDIFPDYASAVKAAYKRFRSRRFFVKEIQRTEHVHHVTLLVAP